MVHTSTVYVVKVGDLVVSSYSTDTYLTDRLARATAIAYRDNYNASEAGTKNPARIIRSHRQRIVKPL